MKIKDSKRSMVEFKDDYNRKNDLFFSSFKNKSFLKSTGYVEDYDADVNINEKDNNNDISPYKDANQMS